MNNRRWWAVTLAVLAAVGITAVGAALWSDDDGGVTTAPRTVPSTTTAPSTSTSTSVSTSTPSTSTTSTPPPRTSPPTTKPRVTVPATVTIISARSGGGSGEIVLDWNAVATATGYQVLRAGTAEGPFSIAADFSVRTGKTTAGERRRQSLVPRTHIRPRQRFARCTRPVAELRIRPGRTAATVFPRGRVQRGRNRSGVRKRLRRRTRASGLLTLVSREKGKSPRERREGAKVPSHLDPLPLAGIDRAPPCCGGGRVACRAPRLAPRAPARRADRNGGDAHFGPRVPGRPRLHAEEGGRLPVPRSVDARAAARGLRTRSRVRTAGSRRTSTASAHHDVGPCIDQLARVLTPVAVLTVDALEKAMRRERPFAPAPDRRDAASSNNG